MLMPLIVFTLLAVNAWTMPATRWQWQLQLVTLEFGHWLALACALLPFFIPSAVDFAALLPEAKISNDFTKLYLAVEVLHLVALPLLAWIFVFPARQAALIARREGLRFSWRRLWLPFLRHTGPHAVRRERRNYWQAEGDRLDLVIHCPADSGSTAVPCLLIAHTGGWDSGDPAEFRFANAEIASHGYVVCNFGYRLAPQHRWPAQAEDTRRALAWLRDHAAELGIDTHRIVLMGRSAGAQIAAACAYSLPDLDVRACISVYGPPNMHLARKWSLPNDILKSLTLVRQYMGGDPHEVPEIYRTASATEFVNHHRLPTLLIHGTRDTLVDIRHSRRFTELIGTRADYQFLELPWGTHGTDYFPSTPGGQLSIAAILRVMERYAGPAA